MCTATLPGPSALRCTLPAPHHGQGHLYEGQPADPRHDDQERE